MLDPGSPLKRFQRESVRHTSHLLFLSFRGNLASLFEPKYNGNWNRLQFSCRCTQLSSCPMGVNYSRRSIFFSKISDKIYREAVFTVCLMAQDYRYCPRLCWHPPIISQQKILSESEGCLIRACFSQIKATIMHNSKLNKPKPLTESTGMVRKAWGNSQTSRQN